MKYLKELLKNFKPSVEFEEGGEKTQEYIELTERDITLNEELKTLIIQERNMDISSEIKFKHLKREYVLYKIREEYKEDVIFNYLDNHGELNYSNYEDEYSPYFKNLDFHIKDEIINIFPKFKHIIVTKKEIRDYILKK